ncbi:hypothetical protein B0H14DRAFT_2612440 [Mycena olivaceomarginata]|nr:hypothetical protein B0H14DRAFT_2612440 [Mycena olivaceomarginata]
MGAPSTTRYRDHDPSVAKAERRAEKEDLGRKSKRGRISGRARPRMYDGRAMRAWSQRRHALMGSEERGKKFKSARYQIHKAQGQRRAVTVKKKRERPRCVAVHGSKPKQRQLRSLCKSPLPLALFNSNADFAPSTHLGHGFSSPAVCPRLEGASHSADSFLDGSLVSHIGAESPSPRDSNGGGRGWPATSVMGARLNVVIMISSVRAYINLPIAPALRLHCDGAQSHLYGSAA